MATQLIKATDDGFVRTVQLLKSVRDTLKSNQGDLTSLTTTQKSSLVLALNEVKSIVDSKSTVNDTVTGSSTTWSSTKISSAISQAVTDLINGADSSSDTLKDLADKVAGLVQADNGLVSANQVQSFTEQQKQTARNNIDVYSKTEIGDITSADFVATVNSTYNMT